MQLPFINQELKKNIGAEVEAIVKSMLERDGHSIVLTNEFDLQTLQYGIEVKSCRWKNNNSRGGKNRNSNSIRTGRFLIYGFAHQDLKNNAKTKGLIPVYWFVLRINRYLNHCFLTADEVDKFIFNKNKLNSILWQDIFKKGKDVTELMV